MHISLFGHRGSRNGVAVPVVGKRLMDALWREIQTQGIKTKGINHWVYLPNDELFTGVELADAQCRQDLPVEQLTVSLARYLRYRHIGPYAMLPQIWPQLLDQLRQRGETPTPPHLEIYGHWQSDETKCETTILIGLA
ncbi:MAG: hypothetical protein R2867_29355 [Caldilineaceae bacterium]